MQEARKSEQAKPQIQRRREIMIKAEISEREKRKSAKPKYLFFEKVKIY